MDFNFMGLIILMVFVYIFYKLIFGENSNINKDDKSDEYVDKMEVLFEAVKSGEYTYSHFESPVKLRPNEKLIASYDNVLLGSFKNTGNVDYVGGSGRVNIVKGFGVNLGRRKAVYEKDWVFDQKGTLYITDKRLLFDGDCRNTSIQYNKLLKAISVDGAHLMVEKETGKDICFKFSNEFKPEHSLFVYLRSIDGMEVMQ
jgi:hypothetical protein